MSLIFADYAVLQCVRLQFDFYVCICVDLFAFIVLFFSTECVTSLSRHTVVCRAAQEAGASHP